MDRDTAARLVSEIAPLVAGSRVSEVTALGADCLLLGLAGERRRHLGAVTMKAMPILLLLNEGDPIPKVDRTDAPPFVSQLKGSTLVSLEPLVAGTGALAHLRWTSQVGRTIDRWLTIDLGRDPSMVLSDVAPQATAAAADEAGRSAGAPSTGSAGGAGVSSRVTTWHDEQGRLHARLSSAARDKPAGDSREFDSLNAGSRYMFTELWPELDLSHRREAVERVIERRLKRTRRAMDKVQQEIDDSENSESYRRAGQLLMAQQDKVARGKSSVTLVDFDGTTRVDIVLDQKSSAKQNAEAYFRRAKKAERRSARAPVRLGELDEKAEELRSAADELAGADANGLARLEERFLSSRPKTSDRKAPKERARFRTYRISGGWEVLVGKTNHDNDVLTHKMAKQDDLWFHARQVAGSHVILRKSGQKAEPDKRAILEAAAIAAFHSKAGKSSKVSVCYTEKRHVRKARGGKPGLAVVAREKVVMVRPKLPES